MGYLEGPRRFWRAVAEDKCQQEFYTEDKGWQECNQPVEHIHHIEPERWTLEVEGKEADDNVALPLCQDHHVGDGGEIHSRKFSYHPDMGEAKKAYRDWKMRRDRLEVILEKRITKDAYPSPYHDAIEQHNEAVRNKERYWEGTPETEEYYIQKMRNKAVRYLAETGEKKPVTKRRFKRHKDKPKWYDNLFG